MKKMISLLMITLSATAFGEALPGANSGEVIAETELKIESPKAEATATAELPTATETAASRNKGEESIPVVLEKAPKAAASESLFGRIFGSLVIGLALIFGAWMAYKRIWKRAGEKLSNTRIKVLSQHHFGPKKSVALVRVAGETLLIGVTDSNVNLVKSLSLLDEEIPEEVPKSFSSVFQGSAGEKIQFQDDRNEAEGFSISAIKDVVSNKLKGMRSLE